MCVRMRAFAVQRSRESRSMTCALHVVRYAPSYGNPTKEHQSPHIARPTIRNRWSVITVLQQRTRARGQYLRRKRLCGRAANGSTVQCSVEENFTFLMQKSHKYTHARARYAHA